jgi:hypothetical protein
MPMRTKHAVAHVCCSDRCVGCGRFRRTFLSCRLTPVIPVMAKLEQVLIRINDWFISEDAFVARLLARLPPTPPNYQQIVDPNERGASPAVDVNELEAGANRCAVG